MIGANLFQQFVVRLDARRRVLDLLPYPDEAPPTGSEDPPWAGRDRTELPAMGSLVPVCQTSHLLLVNAKLDADASGYLILDTGAAFSSIARNMTVPLAEPPDSGVSGPGGVGDRISRRALSTARGRPGFHQPECRYARFRPP